MLFTRQSQTIFGVSNSVSLSCPLTAQTTTLSSRCQSSATKDGHFPRSAWLEAKSSTKTHVVSCQCTGTGKDDPWWLGLFLRRITRQHTYLLKDQSKSSCNHTWMDRHLPDLENIRFVQDRSIGGPLVMWTIKTTEFSAC